MYEVNKRIADVTGTLGKSAESEFVFAIENNNNICGGIHFDIIQTNVKKSREYDIVLINNEYVALVEVPLTLCSRDKQIIGNEYS